jgi:hypothetical protein
MTGSDDNKTGAIRVRLDEAQKEALDLIAELESAGGAKTTVSDLIREGVGLVVARRLADSTLDQAKQKRQKMLLDRLQALTAAIDFKPL